MAYLKFKDTPENREYVKRLKEVATEVKSWPISKREGVVGDLSGRSKEDKENKMVKETYTVECKEKDSFRWLSIFSKPDTFDTLKEAEESLNSSMRCWLTFDYRIVKRTEEALNYERALVQAYEIRRVMD